MNFKAIASVVAISSAVLISGPANAQSMMIGAQTYTEDELPAIQERCDQLNLAATTESLTEESEEVAESAGEADATIEGAEDVNEVEDATTTVDLDLITLQECKDAGLIDSM